MYVVRQQSFYLKNTILQRITRQILLKINKKRRRIKTFEKSNKSCSFFDVR
jgi:hypothetical protein